MTIRADRAASGWSGNGGTSLRRTGDSTPRSSNWTAIHRTLFPRHLRKGCPQAAQSPAGVRDRAPRRIGAAPVLLQDNILLDYDHRVLHYRSPTEGGSSGSPVSDDEWRLIGLHHAGGTGMPQLNKAGGTYAANEGITIDAIRGGLAHRPPECSPL